MKRLLSTVLTLVLLVAPIFAQGKVPAELAAFQAADSALTEAKDALAADSENADLQAAVEEAQGTYDTTLEAARAKRDALEETAPGSPKAEALTNGIFAITKNMAVDGDAGAALGLVKTWTVSAKSWAVKNGPTYAVNLVVFLVIIFVFRILANIAAGVTTKALSSSKIKVSELLKKFFVGVVQKLVFFTGLLIALDYIGVDTGPLLAGIGVVGFVIGFALQDTLSNFASGIMILLYRPFDVGDVITAAGETGKVSDLTLVSTTMHTPDNQKLIVPNSSIWGGTIRNITAQDTRRVDFTVGVGYGDDLDKAQKVLMEVASSHELVLKDPGVQVEVVNLGESSVDFVVRPWAKTSDYWTVYFDLTKAFKQRLDAEGISIPFPQRDLHLIAVPEKMASSL